MDKVHETHSGRHNRPKMTTFALHASFKKCVKRTCRDISRHPDGYINVTMDSIGCLNNITYPGPTEYSMYKCQNFGTARQTAPAPAGQRGDDPIVARTASFTATAACNAPYGTIRTSAPPFECTRGHLLAFTPARTLAWQRSNSHAKTHTCMRVRSICAAGSAASTTRSAATGPPGSCPLTLLTELFAAGYLHRACNMPKPMPTHLRQAGFPIGSGWRTQSSRHGAWMLTSARQ